MTSHSGAYDNNPSHLNILFFSGVPPKTLPRNVFHRLHPTTRRRTLATLPVGTPTGAYNNYPRHGSPSRFFQADFDRAGGLFHRLDFQLVDIHVRRQVQGPNNSLGNIGPHQRIIHPGINTLRRSLVL